MLFLDSGHALDGFVPGRHVIGVLSMLVRRTTSSSSVMRHPAAKAEKNNAVDDNNKIRKDSIFI